MCACAASYAEGTSNDTELETLKKRLQFERLADSCFVLSGTQRLRGIMCRAPARSLPMIRNSRSLRNACSLLCIVQRLRGIMCRARGYADTCAVSHGGVGHRRRGGK
jgi:hypothetical protein